MTGAAIITEFDDAAIRSAIERLVKLSGDKKPLLKRIGLGMVKTTQQHFLEGNDPYGAAWKALRPDYADNSTLDEARKNLKKANAHLKRGQSGVAFDPSSTLGFKEGEGILRGKAMRGGLMGSITFRLMGSNALAVGTNKKYGAVHQFGAVIKPVKAKALVFHVGGKLIRCKQVVIPARPYLGFGPQEQRVVTEMVNLTLSEAITGYAARAILSGG